MVFRRIWAVRIHLSKFTLSTRQPLLGGSQQPFHRPRSVAFDGVPVIVQTAVAEDTEIKLRRGIAAFRGKNKVLDSAALHQRILTAPQGLLLLF